MNNSLNLNLIRFFWLSWSLILSSTTWAKSPSSSWEIWKKKENLVVYTKTTDNNQIYLKGNFTVSSSLSGFLLFIQDSEQVPSWLSHARKSKVIKQLGPLENIFVTYFNGVWPAEPRHMVLHTKIIQAKNGSVSIHSTDAGDKLLARKDSILIEVNRAHWEITPSRTSHTLSIDYELQITPKGDIPIAVINQMSLSSMFDSLANIQQQLPHSQWQDYELKGIREVYTTTH